MNDESNFPKINFLSFELYFDRRIPKINYNVAVELYCFVEACVLPGTLWQTATWCITECGAGLHHLLGCGAHDSALPCPQLQWLQELQPF